MWLRTRLYLLLKMMKWTLPVLLILLLPAAGAVNYTHFEGESREMYAVKLFEQAGIGKKDKGAEAAPKVNFT